jgi:serine/threonine protein kinase
MKEDCLMVKSFIVLKINDVQMVMEYCTCSLADVLKYCPEIQVTELQIAAVCASVAKGLAYLHAFGTSHRSYQYCVTII